ncbi:Aphid transmission protein [Spatholobus suberectus]|nr:Aphid transmission protein [Spatholobus suberectus]
MSRFENPHIYKNRNEIPIKRQAPIRNREEAAEFVFTSHKTNIATCVKQLNNLNEVLGINLQLTNQIAQKFGQRNSILEVKEPDQFDPRFINISDRDQTKDLKQELSDIKKLLKETQDSIEQKLKDQHELADQIEKLRDIVSKIQKQILVDPNRPNPIERKLDELAQKLSGFSPDKITQNLTLVENIDKKT